MRVCFCKYCGQKTAHTKLTENVFRETNEPIFARVFMGIISGGMSELLSNRFLECNECGTRRDP